MKHKTTGHEIPDDPDEPFIVNGIQYANRKEFEERVERDLKEFAELLYDIYESKKRL